MLDFLYWLITGDCGRACGHYRLYGWVPEVGCGVHDPDGLLQRIMNFLVKDGVC